MNVYEERQATRKARYEARAAAAAAESTERANLSHKMASAIPFGQPVHGVRDRNYRDKIGKQMDKAVEAGLKAAYWQRKAESVGLGGISSDDPDAVKKLEAKLEKRTEKQEYMKAVNAALRLKNTAKGDARLAALGMGPDEVAARRKPNEFGRIGVFPRWMLSNNNAEIRRIKQRIEDLRKAQEREDEAEDIETDLYTYRIEDNRVQFIFDGKPEPAVRGILKRYAFRWSPSRGAWVRQATANGIYAAKRVRKELDEMAAIDKEVF